MRRPESEGVKLHRSAGPSLRVLLALVAGVLLAHGVVLLGSVSPLSLQMPAPTRAASSTCAPSISVTTADVSSVTGGLNGSADGTKFCTTPVTVT